MKKFTFKVYSFKERRFLPQNGQECYVLAKDAWVGIGDLLNNADYHVCISTGVLDKNGWEIYCDDIVFKLHTHADYVTPRKFRVFYELGSFKIGPVGNNGTTLCGEDSDNMLLENCITGVPYTFLEVSGNAFVV